VCLKALFLFEANSTIVQIKKHSRVAFTLKYTECSKLYYTIPLSSNKKIIPALQCNTKTSRNKIFSTALHSFTIKRFIFIVQNCISGSCKCPAFRNSGLDFQCCWLANSNTLGQYCFGSVSSKQAFSLICTRPKVFG